MTQLPATTPASDNELAEQVWERPDAFGGLYDRHFDAVYHFALRRCGHPTRAEEVTAQTFYRALRWLSRNQWRTGSVRAWLLTIAVNVVKAQGIAEGRTVSLDGAVALVETLAAPQTPPDASVSQDEEAEALWALVTTLPRDQHRAVVLRFAHDMSFAEISVVLGRSEDAAKQLLYRALRTLRKKLEEQGACHE
jgi:RNA polymerase sigma-70 factor (ECF subfamily)